MSKSISHSRAQPAKPSPASRVPVAAAFNPVVFTPTIKVPQPGGGVLVKAGEPVVLNGDDEIGVCEAARIIGCHHNSIYRYLDEGLLRAGADWRQVAPGKKYFLKRAAVLRLSQRLTGNGPEHLTAAPERNQQRAGMPQDAPRRTEGCLPASARSDALAVPAKLREKPCSSARANHSAANSSL